MFFRRKPSNRRADKNRVLHVKLSSKQTRAQAIRLAATALGVSLGTLAVLFGFWAGSDWILDQLVFKNEMFAVKNLEISSDGALPPAQIQKWAEVKLGDNIFALDMTRIRRQLEWVPVVQKASLERVLPHTLKIRVTEREPIARVAVYDLQPGFVRRLYLIDSFGHVMEPLRELPGWAAEFADQMLPLLTGIPLTELRPGFAVDSDQVRAALQLIELFETSTMSGLVDLSTVDVSSPGVLVVMTTQGSEITFALNDLERQLRRWRSIYDHGAATGQAIATLDLSISNNVPARWVEADLVPAADPKPLPTPRHKKKHV